eukprot:TRINITY_DN11262_c4_g1_i1.p1 TRINITY_DN11262_c4_g1~~TRINITY_DN11262_c4_g1_i1.p1  ORF type:complete len:417 (+),score=131.59 TRINITY_DN11262_c4_g1_i1:88-1338(+)
MVNAVGLTVNVINGCLGAGILSMPWGAAGASFLGTTLLIIIVFFVNCVTGMVLIEAGERLQVFELGALLSHLPGRLGKVVPVVYNVAVWISMWMCLVGYMIIVADSLTEVTPKGGLWQDRKIWVALGSVLCFPLCFMDQEHLSFTSALSILVNVYLFALVSSDAVYLSEEGLPGGFCVFGVGLGSVTFVSNMMYSIILQMCMLPMYHELEDRSPKKFFWVLMGSFVFLTVLFILFAAAGYLAYGTDVQSNVLKNAPRDMWGDIGRVGMLLVILGVYPIMVLPMVTPIREMEDEMARKSSATADAESKPLLDDKDLQPTRFYSAIATFLIVFTVMPTAFFVRDLGFMNVVNGAMSAIIFVGVLPGLVAWYLLGHSETGWRVAIVLGIAVCAALSLLGLVFSRNYHEELADACLWNLN